MDSGHRRPEIVQRPSLSPMFCLVHTLPKPSCPSFSTCTWLEEPAVLSTAQTTNERGLQPGLSSEEDRGGGVSSAPTPRLSSAPVPLYPECSAG